MRGGLAFLGEISLLTTEISPRRAGNFHINALKRAGPPRRDSCVHTTKVVIMTSNCLDNFSFHQIFLYNYV